MLRFRRSNYSIDLFLVCLVFPRGSIETHHYIIDSRAALLLFTTIPYRRVDHRVAERAPAMCPFVTVACQSTPVYLCSLKNFEYSNGFEYGKFSNIRNRMYSKNVAFLNIRIEYIRKTRFFEHSNSNENFLTNRRICWPLLLPTNKVVIVICLYLVDLFH